MQEEDRLVSLPPTDLVLQRRLAALKDVAEAKQQRKELKPARVKEGYIKLLSKFANAYFKGMTRYDGLSQEEQKVLAKICLRHSLKKCFITILPMGIWVPTFISLAKGPGDLVALSFLTLILGTVAFACAEVVMDVTGSLHIYEAFGFMRRHLYLKRKNLLQSLFK